jgi:hypothetical protein
MNVEIGAEAAQFPEKQCSVEKMGMGRANCTDIGKSSSLLLVFDAFS